MLPSFDLLRVLKDAYTTRFDANESSLLTLKVCHSRHCGAAWLSREGSTVCPLCRIDTMTEEAKMDDVVWKVIGDMIRAGYTRFSIRSILSFVSLRWQKKGVSIVDTGSFNLVLREELIRLERSGRLFTLKERSKGGTCIVYSYAASAKMRFVELMPFF